MRRKHLHCEAPPLDFPGIQGILVRFARQRQRGRASNPGTLGAGPQRLYIRGRRGLHMPAVDAGIVHFQVVQPERLVRVILNDDQNGQNAILIRDPVCQMPCEPALRYRRPSPRQSPCRWSAWPCRMTPVRARIWSSLFLSANSTAEAMKSIAKIQSAFIRLLYWACRVAASPAACILFRLSRDARAALPAAHPRAVGPWPRLLLGDAARLDLVACGFGRRGDFGHGIAAGIARAQSRHPALRFGGNAGRARHRRTESGGLADGVFFAPIDYAFAVRRWLRRIRPAVVVILETEIWPLLYREVKSAGCALVVVNGRISDRAFPRYRALPLLLPARIAARGSDLRAERAGRRGDISKSARPETASKRPAI